MKMLSIASLALLLGNGLAGAATPLLRISVYATAGDVQAHLTSPENRQRVLRRLEPLRVNRLFLEGRRGDEYVSPAQLKEVRDFFVAHGIECSGGIATVPGAAFGARQNGGLDWLNWESEATRRDVARFFGENAPLFDELIVDDFYCTADTSPSSERARGVRSWSDYRRDLLVGLIEPLMRQPARAARPSARLILKFPQWYDRFHLFGYDPPRMIDCFESIWVGTEVRNPKTRRMGFVQPTEGYLNFRWLAAQAGPKAQGAWFDHIECNAQQFVDQAFQSALAGALELTLFRLGDIMQGHPGDALLAQRLPELMELAERVRGQPRQGIIFYKPAGSDAEDNMYLADYLGMLGLPILPEARYPEMARAAFLPAQAAADPELLGKLRRHLKRGATVVLTPALVRALGEPAGKLAGVKVGPKSAPTEAVQASVNSAAVRLAGPLQIDAALERTEAQACGEAVTDNRKVPLLTSRAVGPGRVLVLNVRTFSTQDFRDSGEWLLAPKPRGLSDVPQELADRLRVELLRKPLEVDFQAPAGVALHLFDKACCVYNFRAEPVSVSLAGESFLLPANQWRWRRRP